MAQCHSVTKPDFYYYNDESKMMMFNKYIKFVTKFIEAQNSLLNIINFSVSNRVNLKNKVLMNKRNSQAVKEETDVGEKTNRKHFYKLIIHPRIQ